MNAIRIEGQRTQWLAYPCQSGAERMDCRAPIAPNRGPAGESVAIVSAERAPITAEPMISCALCGWAGFIRDGAIETVTPGDPRRVDRALAAHFGDEPL